ncbi:MAG: hypothetical protein E2O35_00575 [Proteobacteria bacterium]|nr:MAG: hypothetical protein E2O35_00575 [Pseudomonadota bacterium]
MPDNRFTIALILLVILGLATPWALAGSAAGTVVFASGEVKAIDAHGHTRYLIKGDRVSSGDTVTTDEGKVQIRFTDGGYASLKANTHYRLSDYVFRDSAGREDRGFFSLLKGTVRFVTGAIGKAKRKSFHIKTKTATIGIRGSSGLVVSCVAGSCGARADGTYLTTYSGILTIASGSFSGEVLVHETYYCDGTGCVVVNEDQSALPLAPLIPELDRGYRQGDQQHIDPGAHTPSQMSPGAARGSAY